MPRKKTDLEPIVPVDVFKSTYQRLAKKAEDKGQSIRAYVNELLLMNVEKDEVIRAIAPSLSYNGMSSDKKALFIADTRHPDVTIEITRRDSELRCSFHKSADCEHVHFALAIPEVAKLVLRKV